MNKTLIALVLSLACSVTVAKTKYEHTPVAFDPQVFEEQRGDLVEEITRGERYREIGNENQEKVLAALDEMGQVLANVTSLDQLTDDQRATVFNNQELVNEILTRAAKDSRLICKRETPVGSHRQITICKSVAQRNQDTENAKNIMRERTRVALPVKN